MLRVFAMTSERANAYERNYIWNFVLVQIVDHVAGKLLKVRGSRRTFSFSVGQ